jgi:polysaccharide pyruvyl transferase WcaK-like protein
LPDSSLSSPAGIIRGLSRGRPVVAISPICFAKSGQWPTPDRALYDRYVQQIARVLSRLSEQGYFLVVCCSSLGDDETVIPDILLCLDEELKSAMEGKIHFPSIKTWRDFTAVLCETDCLVASRLHGTILGFVTRTPVVAVSFNPKVDWVMEDLGQTDYLLHIRDFTADDVIGALDRVKSHRSAIVAQINSYRSGLLANSDSTRQYDFLAGLALKHHQSHI